MLTESSMAVRAAVGRHDGSACLTRQQHPLGAIVDAPNPSAPPAPRSAGSGNSVSTPENGASPMQPHHAKQLYQQLRAAIPPVTDGSDIAPSSSRAAIAAAVNYHCDPRHDETRVTVRQGQVAVPSAGEVHWQDFTTRRGLGDTGLRQREERAIDGSGSDLPARMETKEHTFHRWIRSADRGALEQACRGMYEAITTAMDAIATTAAASSSSDASSSDASAMAARYKEQQSGDSTALMPAAELQVLRHATRLSHPASSSSGDAGPVKEEVYQRPSVACRTTTAPAEHRPDPSNDNSSSAPFDERGGGSGENSSAVEGDRRQLPDGGSSSDQSNARSDATPLLTPAPVSMMDEYLRNYDASQSARHHRHVPPTNTTSSSDANGRGGGGAARENNNGSDPSDPTESQEPHFTTAHLRRDDDKRSTQLPIDPLHPHGTTVVNQRTSSSDEELVSIGHYRKQRRIHTTDVVTRERNVRNVGSGVVGLPPSSAFPPRRDHNGFTSSSGGGSSAPTLQKRAAAPSAAAAMPPRRPQQVSTLSKTPSAEGGAGGCDVANSPMDLLSPDKTPPSGPHADNTDTDRMIVEDVMDNDDDAEQQQQPRQPALVPSLAADGGSSTAGGDGSDSRDSRAGAGSGSASGGSAPSDPNAAAAAANDYNILTNTIAQQSRFIFRELERAASTKSSLHLRGGANRNHTQNNRSRRHPSAHDAADNASPQEGPLRWYRRAPIVTVEPRTPIAAIPLAPPSPSEVAAAAQPPRLDASRGAAPVGEGVPIDQSEPASCRDDVSFAVLSAAVPTDAENAANNEHDLATKVGALAMSSTPGAAPDATKRTAIYGRVGEWIVVDAPSQRRPADGAQPRDAWAAGATDDSAFIGVHEKTGERCVIKRVRPGSRRGSIASSLALPSRARRQQLHRDLALALTLNHPRIVSTLEVVRPRNRDDYYVVMEWAAGGALATIAPDGTCHAPRYSLRSLRHIAQQITSALQYLHSINIVHRNVKPSKMLRSGDGAVLLCAALGSAAIAPPLPRATTDTSLPTQQPLGTFRSFDIAALCFRAPEEFFEQGVVDGPAVDMWSLGVSLYALTFGAVPFRGRNFDELRHAICDCEPAELLQHGDAVTEGEAKSAAEPFKADDGPSRRRTESGNDNPAADDAHAMREWKDNVLRPLLEKDPRIRVDADSLTRILSMATA